MATLTEASVTARKAIKFGAIGVLVISILWYLVGAGISLYNKLNPPPLPPPTVTFGKLAPIVFPAEKGRPKLTLELPTGKIPAFPDRMRIYWAPTKRSGFTDANRATDVASALGFLFKPDVLSDVKYQWLNQDQLGSKLEMNIVTGQFMMTRQWQNNPALAQAADFVSDKQSIADLESILKRVGILSDDLVGVEKVTYVKDDAGKLVNALSLSDADFLQIDLFRKNVEEIDPESKDQTVVASYPFYRPDPGKGLIRAIVSGSRKLDETLISLDYTYIPIDYTKDGTYPIKTGDQAWAELSAGGGFIANPGGASEIKVRRIFLGYYDSDGNQKYAMPIYIFLGDKGFTAYVSAVTEDWITK